MAIGCCGCSSTTEGDDGPTSSVPVPVALPDPVHPFRLCKTRRMSMRRLVLALLLAPPLALVFTMLGGAVVRVPGLLLGQRRLCLRRGDARGRRVCVHGGGLHRDSGISRAARMESSAAILRGWRRYRSGSGAVGCRDSVWLGTRSWTLGVSSAAALRRCGGRRLRLGDWIARATV